MKSRSKYTIGLLLVGLCAVALSTGCASMRASSARSAHIHQKTKKHVYDMPCRKVWPSARNLLFKEGYSVKNTGEGSMTLETEWKSSGKSSSRFLVQGIQPTEGECKVNFSKNTRSMKDHDMQSSRDLELEWKLLQKVDKKAAQKIRQEADVKAKAARQS